MHSHVVGCLPDVTARVSGESMQLFFEHSLLRTRLRAQYSAGEALFLSDNITTLSVLKDVRSPSPSCSPSFASTAGCHNAAQASVPLP